MGRLGLTEELADAIVFIASDEASFITGHVLNVDGGHTATDPVRARRLLRARLRASKHPSCSFRCVRSRRFQRFAVDRRRNPMTQHTHQTAPTHFVEANGIRFAYRRFGKPSGVPLVFNQHYTGTMDHWDPAVTDGFAEEREVILFNNAGISSSSGEVPGSFDDMGANAAASSRRWG